MILIAAPAYTEVYTWTDDNGRTHYSDKPRVEQAQEAGVDIGAMPEPERPPESVLEPFERDPHPLVVMPPEYDPALKASGRPVVRYYFGGDCISPTADNWGQWLERFPETHESEDDLQSVVFFALKRASYGNVYRLDHNSRLNVEVPDVRYLRATVTDLAINVCHSDIDSGTRTSDLTGAHYSHFEKINARASVRWHISETQDGPPLAALTTRGLAVGTPGQRLHFAEAVEGAVLNAISGLLATEQFRTALTGPQSEATVSAPGPASPEASPAAQDGMWDHYRQQADFAQALSKISLIKIAVYEYYANHGAFPLSMDAIGYHRGIETPYIDQLRMQGPGRIRARLGESYFPGGQYIELAAEVSSERGDIHWRCETTVKPKIAGRFCKSF